MPGMVLPHRLPLPRNWPRRVRSAVVQAISLADFTLTTVHGCAADSWNALLRMKAESNRLRKEVSLLREEIRIKDARMEHIPAQRRPHYPPTERPAILELRAARGWSAAQAARIFLVTPATIGSWTMRLDEQGPGALVRMLQPVNKFPDFVGCLVRRLKILCPFMGKVKIAQVLARAGLHLGPTTVRRMLRHTPRQRPSPAARKTVRVLTARQPNHVWHVDLTAVPTALGFWTAWLPFAVP